MSERGVSHGGTRSQTFDIKRSLEFCSDFDNHDWSVRQRLLALALAVGIAQPLAAETVRYDGLCEASAAIGLSDGRFAVASDDLDKLAIYSPDDPEPLWSKDLGKVGDIEGAARIGDTVFWITSHSLTEKQPREDKDRRRKLLATVIDHNGLPKETGSKAKELRAHLAAVLAPVLPGVKIDDPQASVLNIEGLAATPGGSLLLGLRAPLDANGDAIVISLAQPFALLGLPQPAGDDPMPEVSRLKLDGRGIRSLEADPDGGYLVVAGPSGEEDLPFALYHWDVGTDPVKVPDADLSGMRPEAMFVRESGVVQVMGDNGDIACSDDSDDGDARPKWFPSRDIRF